MYVQYYSTHACIFSTLLVQSIHLNQQEGKEKKVQNKLKRPYRFCFTFSQRIVDEFWCW